MVLKGEVLTDMLAIEWIIEVYILFITSLIIICLYLFHAREGL